MKKILVPIDFSDSSKNALHAAAEIALRSGAALELLHVNVASIYSVPLSEYVSTTQVALEDKQYDAAADSELESWKDALLSMPAYGDLRISTRVEEGFLHLALVRVVKEDGADLIVMGTKGASGLTEFLVGSNTEKVIRTAPCPVLAIPQSVENFSPRIVLLPSTLKNDQIEVFHYLAPWEKMFSFLTKVLYLNNPAHLPTDGSAEARKNRIAEVAGLTKTDVIITTETFYEDSAILAVADQCNADMIVMGTHQRKGLSHYLFGSITEDTVNHSDVPVLAYPLGMDKTASEKEPGFETPVSVPVA